MGGRGQAGHCTDEGSCPADEAQVVASAGRELVVLCPLFGAEARMRGQALNCSLQLNHVGDQVIIEGVVEVSDQCCGHSNDALGVQIGKLSEELHWVWTGDEFVANEKQLRNDAKDGEMRSKG